jgi:hypothetical protein
MYRFTSLFPPHPVHAKRPSASSIGPHANCPADGSPVGYLFSLKTMFLIFIDRQLHFIMVNTSEKGLPIFPSFLLESCICFMIRSPLASSTIKGAQLHWLQSTHLPRLQINLPVTHADHFQPNASVTSMKSISRPYQLARPALHCLFFRQIRQLRMCQLYQQIDKFIL